MHSFFWLRCVWWLNVALRLSFATSKPLLLVLSLLFIHPRISLIVLSSFCTTLLCSVGYKFRLDLWWDLCIIIYMYLLFCQFISRVEASRMHFRWKEYANSTIFSKSVIVLCDEEGEKKQAVIYDLSERFAKMKAKVKPKPKITIMQKCFSCHLTKGQSASKYFNKRILLV